MFPLAFFPEHPVYHPVSPTEESDMQSRSSFFKFLRRPITCLLVAASIFSAACNGGGDSGADESSQDGGDTTPVEDTTGGPLDSFGRKVWTVAEILSEPVVGGDGGTPVCGGEFGFKRCLCADDVPSYVRYRPAVAECNGAAAAILSGRMLDAFSIVVRDTQNRDRWPAAGSLFGGCSAQLANSVSPPNRCSAFKVQKKFEIGGGSAKVHCFGASGYSDIFADAVRLTVKLSDDPSSSSDTIERYCLRANDEPLN